MIKKYILSFLMLIVANTAVSSEAINLPNLEILGKKPSESFNLFVNKNKDAIEPIHISFRVYKNKINIIELTYPQEIGFEIVRTVINKTYGKFKQPDQGPKNKPLAIWHLPNSVEIQMQNIREKFIEVIFLTNESFEWK